MRRAVGGGGEVRLVLSAVPSDNVPGLPRLDAATALDLADRYARAGLPVGTPEPITAADVAMLGSTWAKRLGIPDRRAAWRLGLSPPLRRTWIPASAQGWSS